MQHLPIHADIDATGIRIRGQSDVASTDVTASVARPEFGRRKRGEIDVFLPQDDFVDRRGCGRNALGSDALVSFGSRPTASA
jgi:hypothetical protein